MQHWHAATDRAFWELIFAFLAWGTYVYFATRKTQNMRAARIALASALLWVFLSPRLERVIETPPQLVIVVDDSASMARTLDDTPNAQTAFGSACGIAKHVVDAAQNAGAATRLRALSHPDSDLSFDALKKIDPNADSSPLSKVSAARVDDLDVSAYRVLLVSDGIENVRDINEASKFPRTDCIVLGSSSQPLDLRWEDVHESYTLYADEQARIKGKLKILGSSETRKVDARLWDVQKNKLLWSKILSVSGELTDFDYEWDPPRDGKSYYRLEAVALDDPSYIPAEELLTQDFLNKRDQFEYARHNNVAEFTIVPRSKKLKVLLIDAQPRYEYRYAKTILGREDAVELHTLLFSEDPRLSAEDKEHFPLEDLNRRSLADFDLIMIGDVPHELWDNRFSRIVDVALKKGSKTSLWFLGGKIDDAKLLPGTVRPDAVPIVEQFTLTPTAEGRRVFAELPELFENVEFTRIEPYLEPESDSITLFNARGANGAAVPIFLVRSLGSNKIAWQGVDEVWRLRTLEDKTIYSKFLLRFFDYLTTESSGSALTASNVKEERPPIAAELGRLEESDVIAKTAVLQTLSQRGGGLTLDLRDKPREEKERLVNEFTRELFSDPIKIKTREQLSLSPRNALITITLALFFLSWLPSFLFRRNAAFPASAEVVPPRDTKS